MSNQNTALPPLSPEKKNFYCRIMECLDDAHIPFLVGGTYAWGHYTGAERTTKDFDLFLKEETIPAALAVLQGGGYRAEIVFSHWLGKVFDGEAFADLIFNSGNGLCAVDDNWFRHAVAGELFERQVLHCPVEEIIWQKSFIMERERFDGGDVSHLIRARADRLDWWRLVARFQENWRVLLSHLILFGFIYPGERARIPEEILHELMGRLKREEKGGSTADDTCRGPLLSRAQYVIDVEHWGYQDARVTPCGPMSESQLAVWNDAMRADTQVVLPFPREDAPADPPPPAPEENPSRSSA